MLLSRYVSISIYWIRPYFLSKCTYVLISHGMGWEMGTKERTEEWVKKEWQMLLLRISKKFPPKFWLIQGQVNCPAGQFPKVTPPSDLRGQPWLVHQIPQQCWAISSTMFRGQSMGTKLMIGLSPRPSLFTSSSTCLPIVYFLVFFKTQTLVIQ